MNQRTSVLAAFSFLGGLLATACVMTAWFLTYLGGMGDIAGVSVEGANDLFLAARIVAGCTVGPALVSLIFWLAARGAIRESGGQLLGRGLYRTGVLVSLLSLVFAIGGRYSVGHRIDRILADTKKNPTEFLPPKDQGGKNVAPLPALANEAPTPVPSGAWLGAEVRTLDADEARRYGVKGGVRVVSVATGGPAVEAGLRLGDIIISVDRKDLERASDVAEVLRNLPAGAPVEVTLRRDGSNVSTWVTLGARPDATKEEK